MIATVASFGAGAAYHGAVGGDAGDGQGQDGGGQVGHGEPAGGGVLRPHGGGEHRDQAIAVAGRHGPVGQRGYHDPGGEQQGLRRGGGAEQLPAVAAQP